MFTRMMILLLALPVSVFAATDTKSLTIKGEAYTTCTITMPAGGLDLGTRRAGDWYAGGNHLDPKGNYSLADIKLTDCDPGTTLTLKADGAVGASNMFLANDLTNNADLQGSVQVHNTIDDKWEWLYFNGTNPRKVVKLAAGETEKTFQIGGYLRRASNDITPAGKFQGSVTLTFTFE